MLHALCLRAANDPSFATNELSQMLDTIVDKADVWARHNMPELCKGKVTHKTLLKRSVLYLVRAVNDEGLSVLGYAVKVRLLC